MGLTVNPFTGKLGSGSPSLRFNPLAGEFQFSGGTNRIVFDPASGGFEFAKSTAPVDPLAGISFRIRLEAYNDGGSPTSAYTDLAGTILATDPDVDVIASFRNVFWSTDIAAVQGTVPARPMFIVEDGLPAWFWDGIDDCTLGSLPAFGESLIFRAKVLDIATSGALWADDGAPDNSHHPYSNQFFYEPYRVVSRAEGDGSPFDVGQWFVYRCENVGGIFRMWINGTLVSTQAIAVRNGPGLGFVIGYGNVMIPSGGAGYFSGISSHHYILTNASDGPTVQNYLLNLP